jgi:DNA-binding response OmpR family regulator
MNTGLPRQKKPIIVVVDDEEALRTVLASELTSAGYECIAIEGKIQAFAWIIENRPALIISDIKSPDLDGFQFLRLLKETRYTRDIPFVFLTGFADLKNAIQATKMGAQDFVSKPYDFVDLLDTIRRVLSESPPRENSPTEADVTGPEFTAQRSLRFAQERKAVKPAKSSHFRSPEPPIGSQLSLFTESLPTVLSRLNVRRRDLDRWNKKGWVTFGPSATHELTESQVNEIHFVSDVVKSGMSDGMINRLLAQLPRPLTFHPHRIAYSFSLGWVEPVIPPISHQDVAENLDNHLHYLAETRDLESLEEIMERTVDMIVMVERKEVE